ncbi:putative bifunctional diguanylate cyclase/phosphodiesterase [Undibacterium sp. Di24W]
MENSTKLSLEPLIKPRILIVEDEAIVARDIRVQLQELGYDPVGIATNAQQAISFAGELRPNLILMDIQLSGEGDGIYAAQEIRRLFGLPVVFVTSFTADEVLQRAKLIEPYGYVLKPFTQRDLRTVIEMALFKFNADLKQQEAASHTQAILDNMVDGVITINARGQMASYNQAAAKIFGYTADEAIGQNVSLLMPPQDKLQHDSYLDRYHTTGEARMLGLPREVEGQRKDGSLFPMSLAVSQITRGGMPVYIGLIRDLTLHHLNMEEIRRLAFYDPLTQLPNRRLLIDRLSQAMINASRTGQHGALMFLDLDHFKMLNDRLGHQFGDQLLQQVAIRLTNCAREGNTVARIGGDEFVILMESLSSRDFEAATEAKVVASGILTALSQPYQLNEHVYHSTPSIGIVLFMQDSEGIDEIFKKADVAMYQAKNAGRNSIRFFDPNMQETAAAYMELENDLRNGIANHEFLLHYQIQVKAGLKYDDAPIINGVEALVRWHHPKRGMVSPADFIPIAESSGLILPIGQWVLETACRQLVAWENTPAAADWSIAVNVSALQFAQTDFVTQVEHVLAITGANPKLLKLELTESMLADNVDEIIVKMNALRAHGVSFSLDDFGTGYSSLSYLKRLPLSQLKIDQSFVRDILTDPSDAVIAHTIVALAHSLGLKVIAEGVETQAQRDALAEMGCNAYQGYLFGRPVPATKLAIEG